MAHALSTKFGDDDAQWQHMEVRVTRHLRELFDRLRSDLMVADVSIAGCTDFIQIRCLQVIVTRAFVELAECDPEAIVLMRGRTFARHTA